MPLLLSELFISWMYQASFRVFISIKSTMIIVGGYQSGNFQAKSTRMSKRGSKVLIYALMNAAHNVVKNNVTFKNYYDAKMAEGRTHYNALGHCAGKLIRIIWKMLSDELEFNLE